jgi:hypothetical protein
MYLLLLGRTQIELVKTAHQPHTAHHSRSVAMPAVRSAAAPTMMVMMVVVMMMVTMPLSAPVAAVAIAIAFAIALVTAAPVIARAMLAVLPAMCRRTRSARAGTGGSGVGACLGQRAAR